MDVMKIQGHITERRGIFYLASLHGKYQIHVSDELRLYPLCEVTGELAEGEIEQSPAMMPSKDAMGWIRSGSLLVLVGAK